jgi:hypothetical protein
MYIPSELGYGDRGSPPKIPGGSVLIFTMEIIEIQGDKKPAMTCAIELAEDGSVTGTKGCNGKEEKYIEKVKAWDAEKFNKEKARLIKMKGDKMKPELLAWLERREHILKQFVKDGGEEQEL